MPQFFWQNPTLGPPDPGGLKPLVVQKVGKKWVLWLNVPAARAYGARKKGLRDYPDAMVPVARAAKGLDLVPGGEPAKLTKDDAEHIAHMIGRYQLGFGDFVSAYTSEI